MICPECLNSDLKEIQFDADKQDIIYQCEKCHYEFIVNILPDNQVEPEISYT